LFLIIYYFYLFFNLLFKKVSETIRQTHAQCGGYMLDPHTAVGVCVARRHIEVETAEGNNEVL
jgi:threonine synthase